MKLYRYWHFVMGESSAEIYTQAPVDIMLDVYLDFHAFSPEMAIEDLKVAVEQPQEGV